VAKELATDGKAAVTAWGDSGALVTPAYFPALSSTATGMHVVDLMELVAQSGYPRVLVSAYDLAKASSAERARLKAAVQVHRKKGNIAFLDSGVYESYWKQDGGWSYDDFAIAASVITPDIFTTYDGAVHRGGPASSKGYSASHISSSRATTPEALCLAIVHGDSRDRLVKAVTEVAMEALVPNGVAIPERQCGPNIYARIETVRRIRQALDKLPGRPMLHVLGCGHPQAIAAYVLAGADCFDSLDWMQVGLDPLTRSYTDLAMIGAIQCTCAVCSRLSIDNPQRNLLHNLRYYQDFGHELQRMVREGTLQHVVQEFLGQKAVSLAGVT